MLILMVKWSRSRPFPRVIIKSRKKSFNTGRRHFLCLKEITRVRWLSLKEKLQSASAVRQAVAPHSCAAVCVEGAAFLINIVRCTNQTNAKPGEGNASRMRTLRTDQPPKFSFGIKVRVLLDSETQRWWESQSTTGAECSRCSAAGSYLTYWEKRKTRPSVKLLQKLAGQRERETAPRPAPLKYISNCWKKSSENCTTKAGRLSTKWREALQVPSVLRIWVRAHKNKE